MYEDKDPNFVIGLSTGTAGAKSVLSGSETQSCTVTTTNCDNIRVPMSDLAQSENRMDRILFLALARHKEARYPVDLISVRERDDIVGTDIFLSQSSLYEQPGANIRWRVIVASPGGLSSEDSIEPGSILFGAIIAIGLVGFFSCLALFLVLHRKRTEPDVQFADWRFTCAFVLGCALVNGSTLTLVGPNTDATCLVRMWSFNMLFVVALSPLLVKVQRIKKIIGLSRSFQRKTITNAQAALYCVPLIAVQTVICTMFSIFDPPRQVEITEESGGIIMQHVICQTRTNAMFVTETIFYCVLVSAGCVLAYQTRNIDKRFGESKQLIFAMYNIALVTILSIIVPVATDLTPNGEKILQAVGTLWGGVLSSAAFVVPRLLQVRKRQSELIQRSARFRHTAPSLPMQPARPRPPEESKWNDNERIICSQVVKV